MLATYHGPASTPQAIGSLAMRLMLEPAAIARACCDPVRGVVSEVFVKPVVADITRWCARQAEALHLMVADDNRVWREARDREVAREQHESVDELRARLGPTFGLKPVPKGNLALPDANEDEEQAKLRRAVETQRAVEASSRAILGEYASRGIEPIFTNGGLPVSPALVNSLVERGMVSRDVLGARGPMAKARKKRRGAV